MSSILLMNETHVESVTSISAECFSMPWSHHAIVGELENPNAFTLVAVVDGWVVGFVNAFLVVDECYINNIAVSEKHRCTGIASKLLLGLIEQMRCKSMAFISLEVRESNENARKLYEKYGFANMGIRKNFYDKPSENAVIYTKHFDKAHNI